MLGLVGAGYWLTREEGLWLLPTLAVLAIPWLVSTTRNVWTRGRPALAGAVRFLAPPTLAFLSVVILLNSINFAVYGVFRNNDFRSGPFPEAYGALARIKHDEWKRYVVFPRDARQRAYAVSPAARELESYFAGTAGQNWVRTSQQYPKPWGCVNEPQTCNDEILSGWFVWALRDAVAVAGHYSSAADADAYYRQLADEINSACDSGRIPCRAARSSLAPIWRGHYTRETIEASGQVLTTLIGLNNGRVGVPASSITPGQARIFKQAIKSPVSGFNAAGELRTDMPGPLDELRFTITRSIGTAYAAVSQPLAALAILSYFALLLAWRRVKSANISGNSILILTALLVAILSRVGLLGFLEATSIPSNNMLYLLPAIPCYLLFLVASIGLGASAIVNIVRGGRTPA